MLMKYFVLNKNADCTKINVKLIQIKTLKLRIYPQLECATTSVTKLFQNIPNF